MTEAAPAARPATAADAPEVVRLAQLMYESAFGPGTTPELFAAWRPIAERAVVERQGGDGMTLVVDAPGDVRSAAVPELAACGVGLVSARMPNPWRHDGLTGYVQWMSTDPRFRRRGYARAVLVGLLVWFDAQGAANVELHATREGDRLYRSEGFWEGTGGLALRRREWDPPPA